MITCQYCGAKNPQGASFCDGCGAALSSTVVADAQATAQAQVNAARAQATAKQSAVHAKPHFGTGRLPPQTMLGKRYLTLKVIGRGGMAAVYQASDTKSNRVVAIKEMSQDDLAPDEVREALESFKRESELLQKLNHPNLPKVYANFAESGRNYLVMEYIDGETLEQKLLAARGPLRESDVLGWAKQLCAALDYLHQQKPPIIFRDLKPANVMVTKKGEVKLIDFGIARLFSPRQTRDTQALGTPGYAPPEQYGNSQTDARADIYALGATLYHLLTNYDVGKTPFALPPLRSRNPAISAPVASAIERATRLDRNDRFHDVAEFTTALGVSSARQRTAQRPTAGATQQRPAAGARPAGATAQGPTRAQPGQRGLVGSTVDTVVKAATAGVVAAGAAAIQQRMNPQTAKSPAAAFRDAAIAAARTATGGVVVSVQPREIDLNQLRAGQDGAATLTLSGPNGAVVTGSLKALTPWVHLDRTQFNGASTLVQVTARTSEINGSGPQRGIIEVAAGSQRMFIPVRVDVIAAPRAAPRAQRAAPPPFAAAFGGARGGPAAAAGLGAVSPQAAAYAAVPRRPFAGVPFAQPRSLGGLRVALSFILALLLAFGAPALVNALASAQLASAISSPLWLASALLAIGVIGAIVGAPLAYIGASPTPGRLRTTGLLAGLGLLVAALNGFQMQLTPAMTHALPGAAQVGALALTAPLFVAIGAALGALPIISRAVMAIARYVAARYWMAQALAALVGGWLGLTLAQMALREVFQQSGFALGLAGGCGLIVGVAIGLALASPVGFLVRRFAFG